LQAIRAACSKLLDLAAPLSFGGFELWLQSYALK
jgi:hypothetical protein